MHKVLRPLKDAYLTNRVINDQRQLSANVGAAGSLDLYKLYGFTSSGSVPTPNTELSRLLVHFDLMPLRRLVNDGKIDITNPSFSCRLKLHDVYGGQPTPNNFTTTIFPLSASFDEGLGRDVVFYADRDVCNWLTASNTATWFVSGCGLAGNELAPCDYLTGSAGTSLASTQLFVTGEEDLDVDVTTIVSGTLAGLVPDSGFRICFTDSLESDRHTYFVKRFASRTAFNDDMRPKLIVRYDDSVQDDTDNMYLDSTGYMFLYNYVRSVASNLVSGSSVVTGNDSLVLKLVTAVSGGTHSLYFTGSQHLSGRNPQTGIYSASVFVPASDPLLIPQWQASGSITFTPVWTSLDGTLTYVTDSPVTFSVAQRGSRSNTPRRFEVSVVGVHDRIGPTATSVLRVNIFDRTAPYVTRASRLPVELPGDIIRDVHCQVRDTITGLVCVPFDTATNSTRVSNDSAGMYYRLDASNLTIGHSYVIDVLIMTGDDQQTYESVSPQFKMADAA